MGGTRTWVWLDLSDSAPSLPLSAAKGEVNPSQTSQAEFEAKLR